MIAFLGLMSTLRFCLLSVSTLVIFGFLLILALESRRVKGV
jgi:hypothetical protein